MAYELTDRMRKSLEKLSDSDSLAPHEMASVRMARARLAELETQFAAAEARATKAERDAARLRKEVGRVVDELLEMGPPGEMRECRHVVGRLWDELRNITLRLRSALAAPDEPREPEGGGDASQ